jgi:CubicO group peptidase (beta-lactamase class C family)
VLCGALADARIELDSTVASVVGELQSDWAHELSFRDLLLHRDGIDGVFWTGFGDDAHALSDYAAACSDLPSIFRPGTSWGYSNSAYVIAGRAIELLTSRRYEHAVEQHLLAPARCRSTSLVELRPPTGGANGHYATADGLRCAEVPSGQRALAPAGSTAWSTPPDLLALAGYLLRPARALDLLDQAVALPPAERDAATHQTLGWKVFRWAGADCFGHDGGSSGQATFLRWIPGARAGIALCANTTPNAMPLWDRLSSWFYDRVGLTPPGERQPDPGAELDHADLGIYESRAATFELAVVDGDLRLSVRRFGADTATIVPAQVLGPGLYRTAPIVDPYGLVSTETTSDGARLLHAGPFTARRSWAA